MSAKTTASAGPPPSAVVSSRSRGPARAFTLLELLLVATLMAVLAGVMVPRLNRAYRGLQFRGEIHQITSLIDYAAEMAIRSRSEVRLRFTQAGDRLWLEGEQLENFGRQRSPYDHPARAITLRTEHQELQDGESATIRFFPDGSRTEDLLTLRDNSGRMRWIRIGRSFAELEVTREKPEEVES